MEDAVTIANTLHTLLAAHPNKKPSAVELYDKFRDEYQNARLDRVRAIVKVGGDLTRQQAYDGWKPYLTQRWLTPFVGLDTLAKNIAGLCVTAPKLSYIDFEEQRGELEWQDTMAREKEREMRLTAVKNTSTRKLRGARLVSNDNWSGGFEAVFPQVLGVLVFLWSFIWFFHLAFSRQWVVGFGVKDSLIVRGDNNSLNLLM